MTFMILLCSTYIGHADLNSCTPLQSTHYQTKAACESELTKLRAEAKGKHVSLEGPTTSGGLKSESKLVCKAG
jgi:hypothetical protein